jgi:hypothetical protein
MSGFKVEAPKGRNATAELLKIIADGAIAGFRDRNATRRQRRPALPLNRAFPGRR